MKILSVDQIREADAYTISNEPVSSIDLMERAASACVKWIMEQYSSAPVFHIICGTGNNGGDGLAAARLLSDHHYKVMVYVIRSSQKQSDDFLLNCKHLPQTAVEINSIEDLKNKLIITKGDIVIDAIFGSGLNKPVEVLVAEIIIFLNALNNAVVSIDVPSGMYCDRINNKQDIVINADHTLSFQFPKYSFMFPENADRVGELWLLDIGLHADYIRSAPTVNYYLTRDDVASLLKKRSRAAHKGSFGHALIIAGSHGKAGAAVLAGKAALRSGTGLLTLHIPECAYAIIQSVLPEAMVSVDSDMNFWFDNIHLEKYNAIGAGPGIGTEKQTQNALKLLIQNTHVPLVLDADALNIISENKTWLAFLPANSILTPHPKEFERLTEKVSSGEERLKVQREFSIRNKMIVVLKGVHTSVSFPDGSVYFNSTGNPGMAKGGSGDALTGILTALMAQGYSPKEASLLGVYLHGCAGDLALIDSSVESMLPTDLIGKLSSAFNFLK